MMISPHRNLPARRPPARPGLPRTVCLTAPLRASGNAGATSRQTWTRMSLLTLGVALLLTALAVPVRAQTGGAAAHSHGADGSHAAPASTPASSAAQSATGEGEVRRIERATGRVTLRHGELKALDMPPMTMVFQARDGVLPPDLKVGDKVRFNVVSEAGRMTLTALQIVR